MSKFPFLPIDVDAYFGATRHLTAEQHGAYFLLLMEAWRRPSCSIPNDDEKLARLACVDLMKWHEIKPEILEFWDYDGRSKSFVQKRLKKERNYVRDVRQKKRDSAASRWKTKKKGDASAYASAMHLTPSLSQGSKEPKKEVSFWDWEGWFSEADIAFLDIDHHSWIDVRKKVSERSFYDWAMKQDSRVPKRIATNWFKSNKEKTEAENRLTARLQVVNGGKS